jgi:GT2 family glycosyltransferase
MSSPPPLAVVVPSARASPHLPGLLASLGEAADVFVVSEAPKGPGNRVITPKEAGFAERANLGLAAARDAGHPKAVLCNDDLVFLPGALRGLADALDEPSPPALRVGVAGPLVLEWDGKTVQQAGISVSLFSGRIRALRAAPREVQAVSGAAMAIDLACWEEIGGFDERFEFYFEDIDFCLRARAADWQLRLVETARVRHLGGGTRSQTSPEAAGHLGRSHALFCRGLPGGSAARTLRLWSSGAAGLGWSLRTSGLSGARRFARGWREGLKR